MKRDNACLGAKGIKGIHIKDRAGNISIKQVGHHSDRKRPFPISEI